MAGGHRCAPSNLEESVDTAIERRADTCASTRGKMSGVAWAFGGGCGQGGVRSRTEPGEQGVITLRHGHLAADRAGVLGRFGGCHHFPPARGARGKWRQSAHACQPGSPHAWEPGAPPACAEHQRMHSAHRVLGLKRLRPHERGADTRAPGRRRTGTRATSADRRRGCSLRQSLSSFLKSEPLPRLKKKTAVARTTKTLPLVQKKTGIGKQGCISGHHTRPADRRTPTDRVPSAQS